jgi:hypothetical protein
VGLALLTPSKVAWASFVLYNARFFFHFGIQPNLSEFGLSTGR